MLPILAPFAAAGVTAAAGEDAAGERTAEDFATALSALAAALRKVTDEDEAPTPSVGVTERPDAGDGEDADTQRASDTVSLGAVVAGVVAESTAAPVGAAGDGSPVPEADRAVIGVATGAEAGRVAASISGASTAAEADLPTGSSPPSGVATAGVSATAESPAAAKAFLAAESEVAEGRGAAGTSADARRASGPSVPSSGTAAPTVVSSGTAAVTATAPRDTAGRAGAGAQASPASAGTAPAGAVAPGPAGAGNPGLGEPAGPTASHAAAPASSDGRPRGAALGGASAGDVSAAPQSSATATARAGTRPDAQIAGAAIVDERAHLQSRGEHRPSAASTELPRAFADGAVAARHAAGAATPEQAARPGGAGEALHLAGGAARAGTAAGGALVTQISARDGGADGPTTGRSAPVTGPSGGSSSATTGSSLGAAAGPQAPAGSAAVIGGLARVDLPPGFAALAERIVDALHLSAVRGGSDIRLRVEPEGLGHIDVRVELRDDGVRAMLVTEHEATRALLTSQQHLLEAALARSELRLSGFSVDVSLDQEMASFHDPEDGGADDRPALAASHAAAPGSEHDHASLQPLAPGRLSLRV